MEAYTEFAQVYDRFMDNVPYEAWCEGISKILTEHGISEGLILDLGCGTGTMTRLLRQKGYDMIGVDASAEMLEIARNHPDEGILYLQQDMREFELYGTVAAVVCVCDSLNYITEEEDLLQVFRLVWNYLDPDGVFFFDMNTIYKYKEMLGETTIAENREEGSFIWENYYDPEEQLNQYDLTLYVQDEDDRYVRFEETHIQKAYALERVLELLEKAGLKAEQIFDSDTGEAVMETTGKFCVVARKA